MESLFDKVAGPQDCDFIKKRIQHRCFQMKFAKFLRTPVLKNICKHLRTSDSSSSSLRLDLADLAVFPDLNLRLSSIKGAISCLRQFLATKSPFKMMKDAFYFTKAYFIFILQKLFLFLSFCLDFLVMYQNCLIKKVNFKFYDVTAWLINNCNTHIAQHLEK